MYTHAGMHGIYAFLAASPTTHLNFSPGGVFGETSLKTPL